MDFVLLTAAVTPALQFRSAVAAPAKRLGQYQEALAFWAEISKRLDFQVVVVETTGCPASQLTAEVPISLRPRITTVSFAAKHELLAQGKGCVEAAAIDYALTAASLPVEDKSTFYKATGRLIVQNAHSLLSHLSGNTVMVRRSLDRKYCDTRFFGTTVGLWKEQLLGMADEVYDNQGRYIEHVLAHRLSNSEYHRTAAVVRFPQRPRIAGQSGTSGENYGRLGETIARPILEPLETFFASRLSSKQL